MEIKINFDKPEEWIELYGDYLYNFAMNRVKDPSLAEDLVQETLLAGIKSIDKFEGKSSIKTWLTTILKNKIYDSFNKKSKLEVISDNLDDFNSIGIWKVYVSDWKLNAEQLLTNDQFKRQFDICCSNLDVRLLELFRLKYLDDLESSEICKILEISESNLWVMLHRLRNQIRVCLDKNWFK